MIKIRTPWVLIILFSVLIMACSDSDKPQIQAGKFGMMSDESPQYYALIFVKYLYNEPTLDKAIGMSDAKLASLLRSYHTNKSVQRHVLNLRLDNMQVEPVTGGFEPILQVKDSVSVEVKISGTFDGDKVVDLKKVKLRQEKGEWIVFAIDDVVMTR